VQVVNYPKLRPAPTHDHLSDKFRLRMMHQFDQDTRTIERSEERGQQDAVKNST
jgi:hypothetical protein